MYIEYTHTMVGGMEKPYDGVGDCGTVRVWWKAYL